MNNTTAPDRRIYTPQFPRLMAATGPKCGKWTFRGDRVDLRCVKAAGHDGKHLMDVDPRYVKPEFLPAE